MTRAKSLDGFRKQLDKISNLSSCQVTQYVCADRREQGFTSPAMRWGQRQFKEELTSHQTTSIQNPSPGQHRNLKRQTLSFYNSSVALYLLSIWPMDFPPWGSSCAATGRWQHTQGVLLLVTESVLMALSHRFADIDSDRHQRTPASPQTASGKKEALVILHIHIQGELQGHKQAVAQQQPPRSQSKDPQSSNLDISAWKPLKWILAAATVLRSSFLCHSPLTKCFTLQRQITFLDFIYSGTAVTKQSAPTLSCQV